MGVYFGRICVTHPSLGGKRYSSGGCVTCVNERSARRQKAIRARRVKLPTIKQILATGKKTYLGKICASHPERRGERWCSTRACLECWRKQGKNWRDKNLALSRQRERESAKRRRNENLQKFRERERKRARRSPESPQKQSARCALRRARKVSATPPLTALERARVQEFYDLAAARFAQTGDRWEVDHDVPLARGGLHHPDNLLLLPSKMNCAKGAHFSDTFTFLLS